MAASLPYKCRAVYSGAQGSMHIMEDALYWQREGAEARQAIVAWTDISKHAIAPPNNPKALVKIDLKAGGSIKFEVLAPPEGGKTARDVSVDCKELILVAKRAAVGGGGGPSSSSAFAGSAGGGGGSSAGNQEGKGKGKGEGDSATRWKSDELQKRNALIKARKEIAERSAEQVRARMKQLEKETRKSLLEQHPDLREQYTQMVGEGLISEEDFWDARRRLLLEEQAKRDAKRNKGMPSNILAEIESRAGECANNNVVKLKPRDIQYLFDLYPGLRELHRKKVPEEISEGKFWEQTLRSIRFHRQRANLSQDEYFQAQHIPQVNARDNREDLQRVDPVFDLTAATADQTRRSVLSSGTGRPDVDNEVSKDGVTTVNKLNRGSSLLVRTRHVGSLSEYTDMPDLRGGAGADEASSFQRLQLRNRDLYSTSTVTALEREALPDAPLPPIDLSKLDLSSSYTPDLLGAFPDPQAASEVMEQLSKRAMATSSTSGGLDERDVEESMPRAYVEFSRVSEFVRHFHAFHQRRLAGMASQEVNQKLERLVEKMDQKSKELMALRRSLLTKTKGTSALAFMLIPFQAQLSHAIEIHDAYTRHPPPPAPAPAVLPESSSAGGGSASSSRAPTPSNLDGSGQGEGGRSSTPLGFLSNPMMMTADSPPDVEIIPTVAEGQQQEEAAAEGAVGGAGAKRPREEEGEEAAERGAAKVAR